MTKRRQIRISKGIEEMTFRTPARNSPMSRRITSPNPPMACVESIPPPTLQPNFCVRVECGDNKQSGRQGRSVVRKQARLCGKENHRLEL